MTNITITIDEENGKLLLIVRERFKKYIVRNEKAAQVIKELAKTVKIEKVVRSEAVDFIRCADCDIAIDSTDQRIYRYVDYIEPIVLKALEFEEKHTKKDELASKVTRENTLYRRKVVARKPEPRSDEFRSEVQKKDLKRVILDRLGEIFFKAGVTVLGAYLLVAGSVWALNRALNPEPPGVPKNVETSEVTTVAESEYSGFKDFEPYTEQEDLVYLAPEEEQFDGVEFSYNNRCDSEKYAKCKEMYGDKIEYWAYAYGVDPQISIAIATQERGVHSSTKDSGGGVGLFQIQESVWLNHEISAYNHLTGEIDTILVTKDNIGDLDFNIRFGMMVLATCYQQMRGNIPATVQCYNYGYGNMVKVIRNYCVRNGLEELDAEDMKQSRVTDVEKHVLEDQHNIGWTEEDIIKIVNSNGYTIGDPFYLGHIFSYVPDVEFDVTFTNRDGSQNTITIRNGFAYYDEQGMKR